MYHKFYTNQCGHLLGNLIFKSLLVLGGMKNVQGTILQLQFKRGRIAKPYLDQKARCGDDNYIQSLLFMFTPPDVVNAYQSLIRKC